MKSKLKELARYCCKPNEQEYEFIKTCARLGGVEVSTTDNYEPKSFPYMQLDRDGNGILLSFWKVGEKELIPVTQFCDILLKDESEFEFKPKVGDWCAVDYSNSGATRVFFVDEIEGDKLYVSSGTFNGKSSIESVIYLSSSITTFRQPTPEEIQTAIDAWDDRVEFKIGLTHYFSCDEKTMKSQPEYKFRLSEDCKTVEMVKDEVKCGFCVKPKN